MTLAMALAVGLLGLMALVSGCVAVFAASAARKAFEAALADDTGDGLRARGVLLVERIENPALRWVVNRRTGAMAGAVLVGVVRDRLATLRRGGFIALGSGIVAMILAFHLPDMMR